MQLPVNQKLYEDYLWYWQNCIPLINEYGRKTHLGILDKKVVAHNGNLSNLKEMLSREKYYREPLIVSPESPTMYERLSERDR